MVPGGAADSDGRLKTGDEIVRVDGKETLGESHHKVVALMGQASSNGFVNLGVRRRVLVQGIVELSCQAICKLLNQPVSKNQLLLGMYSE